MANFSTYKVVQANQGKPRLKESTEYSIKIAKSSLHLVSYLATFCKPRNRYILRKDKI